MNTPVQDFSHIPAHSLSIVIPMYNEAENVEPMIARVHEGLAGYPHPWELILVDDGSSDATPNELRRVGAKFGPHVRTVELMRNFKQTAAMQAGIERRGLVEEDLIGYKIPFLDGIWLRAPYLHNGSVPTLRDLLEPAAERPKVFWRGYDVFDQTKVGFVTDGDEARRTGTRMDTTEKGGGNQGHEFGTGLSGGDKAALLEYLKTL